MNKIVLFSLLLMLASCGGGGGGSSTTPSPAPSPTPKPSTVVKTFEVSLEAVSAKRDIDSKVIPVDINSIQSGQLTLTIDQ